MSGLIARLYDELGRSDIPISTPDLTLLHGEGYAHARQQVWVELLKLEAGGLVTRSKGPNRLKGKSHPKTVTFWSKRKPA